MPDPKPSPIEKKILELEKALEEALTKAEEAESKQLRAVADLQNLQRRESEQKALWGDMAVGSFLKGILPSFLELQLGSSHTKDDAVRKVIEKFFRQLEGVGIQKIEPKSGDRLDPQYHEVMMAAEGTPGCIVATLEPGWQYKTMVIVPAKVSGAMEQ